jgi:hypothetical protein
MLRDGIEDSVAENELAPTWAPTHRSENKPDWRAVDRALRAIKQRRATLDAEEARWLREAEALQIWRPLGMVSALDYLERALGTRRAPLRSGCGSRVRWAHYQCSLPRSKAVNSHTLRCGS